MQLARHHQHQTHTTSPFILPNLSPLQAAIRAHRVTTARINDADARGEDEESAARLAALAEEERAWAAFLAAPCADRSDAAAVLRYASGTVTPGPAAWLADKLIEALTVALEEQPSPPGGGVVSPISLAIRAHQLAYEARQAASAYLDATGQQARKALSWAAEEAEDDAVFALLETPCSNLREAGALLAHLDWYLSAAVKPGHAPALKARAADLRLFLVVGLSGADREIDALNLGKAMAACREAWGRLQATTAETEDVRWDAEGEARDAADALQETPCGSRADAEALRAHLRWFVPELERADLDGAEGFLEGLRARLADLEMLLTVSPGDDGAGRVPVLVA